MPSSKIENAKGLFDVDESSMRTNKVDQVSSLLSSVLVLVALAVVMLGMLFFLRSSEQRTDTITLEPERVEGRGDNAPGFERDPDPPSADEVSQLNEPAMEQTLQLVSQAISDISNVIESMDAAATNGTGRGDSRQAGPEGEGDKIVPRSERWDLRFTARDRKSYGAQLDFYKIELGVYGGTNPTVEYAGTLSTTPKRRAGSPKDEKRLFFLSLTEGVLKQYDKQFLQGVGIDVSTRPPMKFIPPETEKLLEQAEAAYYIEKRGPTIRIAEIAKTIFESRPSKTNKGFEFVVIDQRYRNAPKK